MAEKLLTEQVSEAREVRPGVVENRTFWIAYPAHVAVYGSMDDRIFRARGVGDTEEEALRDALT